MRLLTWAAGVDRLSTWVLAWIIQPTKIGLVKSLASCFPNPHGGEHGPHNRLVHEGGFVDRLTTSFKYYESRAEHALEFVSNALPLNLRHLAFSYAESAIFRRASMPLTVKHLHLC